MYFQNSTNFEVLSTKHTSALLKFETENRLWFEKFIAARNPDFYTHPGVTEHITECLQLMRQKSMYPALMVTNNELLGRFNLREIDHSRQSAMLGYRVAEKHKGKGVATKGVGKLLQISVQKLGLNTIRALVLDNNAASARVLLKHGFECIRYTPEFREVNGKTYGCREYCWNATSRNTVSLEHHLHSHLT
ncbi:GNAT family N-acetyltransferase [Microbulbifer celer]|uniref:GNAT family N-acetyltransferase n=1 Tax=Microbulbifer celer TaxID=435905 RepID=A0ABW3UCM2_9GAMM